MNRQERFEFVAKLEREQAERKLNDQLKAAKSASKQAEIELIISYVVAQTTNLLMATVGLCKVNGKD